MLFGAGWAITGACPGPIYAQIGSGAWMALFTFAFIPIPHSLIPAPHSPLPTPHSPLSVLK
jgi:hypothetical protein